MCWWLYLRDNAADEARNQNTLPESVPYRFPIFLQKYVYLTCQYTINTSLKLYPQDYPASPPVPQSTIATIDTRHRHWKDSKEYSSPVSNVISKSMEQHLRHSKPCDCKGGILSRQIRWDQNHLSQWVNHHNDILKKWHHTPVWSNTWGSNCLPLTTTKLHLGLHH